MAAMRSVGVRLRLFTDQYKRDAAEATQANDKLTDSAKKSRAGLEEMAGGMAMVGTAMLAAAAVVVFVTAKFDKQMSEVAAVTGATTEEFEALRDAAIQAGAATSFSASQAAEAVAELAKAGVSVQDILGGGLKGALDLAAAGSLNLATAATIAAQAMNIFGLSGRDVTHIADVLAAAANKSATDVEQLGIGLQQVGLVANMVGFSLEETVGLLAAFADNALGGSDGATSLKTALLRLSSPLPEAHRLMDQLGISLYDANGVMVDAVTIAGQLQNALGGMSDAQRNATLATIFGQDAIRAGNVLVNEGAAGIRQYIEAVNDEGAAAEVAAKKLDNLAGDVEKLTGSLESLFIQAGSGVSGTLRDLTQWAERAVSLFSALPDKVQTGILVVVGLTGAGLIATAAMIKFTAALDRTTASLIAMGAGGARAATGLRLATAAAGGLGVALAAISLIDVFANSPDARYRLITEEMQRTEGAAEALSAAAENMGGAFGLAAAGVDGLTGEFERFNGVVLGAREAMRQAEAAVDELREALDESNGSLNITTEEGRAAEAALDELAAAAAAAADAEFDRTQDAAAAHAVWDRFIQQMRDLLQQTGMSEQAIDDLIGSIANMPEFKPVQIQIGATYSGEAAQVISAMTGPGVITKNWVVENRWGGLYQKAAMGVLRQAHIAPPTSPARYAYAEPQTGGEAFVPLRGNYSRSMQILSAAAGHYNADVVPRGMGDGGTHRVDVCVYWADGSEGRITGAVTDGLRFDVVQVGGGDVQNRYGRRGRIG